MLKKKADPNKANAKGKTPLDLVQTSHSPALVRLLEQHGARRRTTTAQDRHTCVARGTCSPRSCGSPKLTASK